MPIFLLVKITYASTKMNKPPNLSSLTYYNTILFLIHVISVRGREIRGILLQNPSETAWQMLYCLQQKPTELTPHWHMRLSHSGRGNYGLPWEHCTSFYHFCSHSFEKNSFLSGHLTLREAEKYMLSLCPEGKSNKFGSQPMSAIALHKTFRLWLINFSSKDFC